METRELPHTPSEVKTLPESFEEEQKKKDDEDEMKEVVEYLDGEEEDDEEAEEEDIQDVYEEEVYAFNRLCRAVHHDDDEDDVRSFLMSSVDFSTLDPKKNNRSQLYATVKELLYKKESVDHRNAFEATSPQMARDDGHMEITRELLKNNAADTSNDSCPIPLPIAPEMSFVEIVNALIDYVGGINEVDENGETALHLAARYDSNAIVKILLNRSSEREALSHLKLAGNQVVPAELEHSEQPTRCEADVCQIPLHFAMQCGYFEIKNAPLSRITTGREHAEIVENLILNGANVNACNNAKMTPLHLACENGHISIVDILLDNHAMVGVNKQAKETPFYLAVKNGHADVVDVLLRRGICDFALISKEQTPLHVAVMENHTKVVEVILKHSCRMFGKLTNDEQEIQENAENLVETRGIMPIELMKPDGRRFSAGIVWTERRTPLEYMLDSGGCTALEYAVELAQPKMVKILLSKDRCVYSEAHLGNSFVCMTETIKTPSERYELMSKMKHTEIIDIMEFLCYDIQYKTECKNMKEEAQLLVNSNNFNANYKDDKHLNTLLHTTINECGEKFSNNLPKKSRPLRLMIQTIDYVIELLLEKGADFNMKNALGETPLIIASEKGCCHAIQMLFDWEQKSGLKLDLDARDQYGATALIKAAESHHVSVMRLLLSHKVSMNLHNYYGFTALHAAVYNPNINWFDLQFFCKGLIKRTMNLHEDFLEIKWGEFIVTPFETIEKLKLILDYDEKTTRFTEKVVKLMLAIDETNVNGLDFRGNTPLDLAVKSSKRITSDTFKAFTDRGAIRNSPEPADEAPVEVARIDDRGRGPLHRLIISHVSNYAVEDMKVATCRREKDHERFDLMVHGILLKPENFRHSANATDDKGRTALHYAVMPQSYVKEQGRDLVRVLLEIGSSVYAVDMYGKTPLHYAEIFKHYAVESIKDNYGHTYKDLQELREKLYVTIYNGLRLSMKRNPLYTSTDINRALSTDQVTELSKRKLAETIRIYPQSPRPKERTEEAIWKIWTENDLYGLNGSVSKLKPSVQRFIDRLAYSIKGKDWRFESQPLLLGSADEGTKAVFSADFDFNFRLTKFSDKCDVFPHPQGPKGYFQLKRKSDYTKRRVSDGEFDCFFNLDDCLLTNEVNSKFQIVLEDVLQDPSFWKDEHRFEWNLTDNDTAKSDKPARMCKTVRLRMIHPIEGGEGDIPFVNVSIDVVACIPVEDSSIGDQLAFALYPTEKAAGCTLVFDRPRFYPSMSHMPYSIFSDTFARISFAPIESRIIKESSSLIKAAYIVCKLLILYDNPKTTYQLKTSLFFCMETLKIREGCERKDDDTFTPEDLAFWVERLMFCFMEFYRHDAYPCYFMPSFKLQVARLNTGSHISWKMENVASQIPFVYSKAFDIYLDICPDGATIDIPIIQEYIQNTKGTIIANRDPMWEQFDKGEFIRKLASRNPSN